MPVVLDGSGELPELSDGAGPAQAVTTAVSATVADIQRRRRPKVEEDIRTGDLASFGRLVVDGQCELSLLDMNLT